MTQPAPPRRAWWAPSRHQGLLAAVVLVAVVIGLSFGGAFARTTPASSAPSDVSAHGAIRGVTSTAIKIVLYQPPENDPVSKIVAQFVAPKDTNAEITATVRGFIKALGANNPALHGRHIDLVVFTGSANLLDSVAARADAVKIMCFMCVNAGSNAFFAAHAPYVWSLEMTPEQAGTHVAEYVKKRLAGRRAAFAGEASLQRTVRRFGLLGVTGPFGRRELRISELSTGQRRVVDLAAVVANRPAVVLLDEPSSGLAQPEVATLGTLLRRAHDDLDLTMVIVEHDIPLVSSLSDRLVVLDQGAVIASGAPADVLADPVVIASYLGTSVANVSPRSAGLVETPGVD